MVELETYKNIIASSELFEKLEIPFDIQTLKNEFHKNTKDIAPVFPSQFFGGWSITSSNGSYKDGWIKAGLKSDVKTIEELRQANQDELQFKGPQYYRQPTELCTGEVKKIIDYLDTNGFFPCRARYTVLRPKGENSFHQDYPSWLYGVRLHIPIITNPECFFEYGIWHSNFNNVTYYRSATLVCIRNP